MHVGMIWYSITWSQIDLKTLLKASLFFLCFVGATFACSLQQVISDWLRVRQRPDNEYASKEVYDIRTPFRWLNLNCMAHRLIISLKIARQGLIGLWQLAWHLCFFFGAYPRQERMEKTTTVQTGFSSSFFMEYRISVMPGSKNRYAGSVDLAMSLPM